MRRKLGTVLMLLGAALLCCALALFLHNRQEAASAEQSAQAMLPQLIEQIPSEPAQEPLENIGVPIQFLNPSDLEMTEVEIDGYDYIGYLSIPALTLELPIMADWDYDRLKIAPCRYTGTLRGENLVLMAHNYDKHFGRLSDLSTGDNVYFTDMDGSTTGYQVVGIDVLPPDAVEEMTSGDFDLTLFTCTYGGQSRVTVYCDIDSAN